nr:MAG TPA: hypothetical protein [Bacteriophage sp.]DAG25760.1 MAG TPA: hypothetical protein [Bacteriophage sp.]DAH14148.1 MAG TPA: hypothetical protein [Caudoviricetes sp.]DAN23289.1 MAG TPA_asm: hypothetical protein [Bacteriophage sp.]
MSLIVYNIASPFCIQFLRIVNRILFIVLKY